MPPSLLERHPPLVVSLAGGAISIVASLLLTHLSCWIAGIDMEDWLFISATAVLCPALIAPPIIYVHCRAIQEIARQRGELAAMNTRLTNALSEVRELSGLLPVCAWCHKVRDDQGYWNKVDAFLERHTRAEVTHSICPECKAREIARFDQPPRA